MSVILVIKRKENIYPLQSKTNGHLYGISTLCPGRRVKPYNRMGGKKSLQKNYGLGDALLGYYKIINKYKTTWNFLRKLKMELPFDPAILLLGLYPKSPETPIQKNL